MHKQTTFIIITAAILLTATLATALYSLKEANAQTNKTSAGANKTEPVTSNNQPPILLSVFKKILLVKCWRQYDKCDWLTGSLEP